MPSPKLASGPVKHDNTPYEMVFDEACALALNPAVMPLSAKVLGDVTNCTTTASCLSVLRADGIK